VKSTLNCRPEKGLPGLRRLFVLGAVLGLSLALPQAAAAVTVSPTALYITHETRSATLTLRNPADRPVEVTIGFVFGYPQNNEAGGVHVPLHEVAPEGERSAAEWLRAFPRQVRLEPGERQVVRVLATPPGDLEDGEYWARVVVTTRGGQAPIEQVTEGRSVRIDMETALVLPASYRKGQLTTGVTVNNAVAEATDEGVALRFDLERAGDAAYLGRVTAEVASSAGEVVASGRLSVAVYRELSRSFIIPWPEGYSPGGEYTIRYRFATERPDLPSAGPIRSAPVEGSIGVVVGG
jgi:hypothetical protein